MNASTLQLFFNDDANHDFLILKQMIQFIMTSDHSNSKKLIYMYLSFFLIILFFMLKMFIFEYKKPNNMFTKLFSKNNKKKNEFNDNNIDVSRDHK